VSKIFTKTLLPKPGISLMSMRRKAFMVALFFFGVSITAGGHFGFAHSCCPNIEFADFEYVNSE
jgi:hypothetical protein